MVKALDVYNYKFSLLRNFGITQLRKLLGSKIPKFDQSMQTASGSNTYEKISNVLNEKVLAGVNHDEVDKTFFDCLVYLFPERCYYLNLNTDISANKAMTLLKSSQYGQAINRKISKLINPDEKLISIRQDQDKLIFLFKLDTVSLGLNKDKCGFYVSCILDFKQNVMEIRLNQHMLRQSSLKLKDVIEQMLNYVDRLTIPAHASRHGETVLHTALYKLFSEESAKSLKLIKNEVAKQESNGNVKVTEKQLRDNISKYLKEELHIANPDPYVEKVMTVKYQDTAKSLKEKVFVNNGGFIFGFSFVDRKITKSVNRNEQHKPVYYSKIYWNLKDLVKEYEEISELSIYWKFIKADFDNPLTGKEKESDVSFVELSFKEIHNVLEIHYYVDYTEPSELTSSLKERRIRENYVIHKIKKYI